MLARLSPTRPCTTKRVLTGSLRGSTADPAKRWDGGTPPRNSPNCSPPPTQQLPKATRHEIGPLCETPHQHVLR